MDRVVHFEISVKDMERADKFYSDIFGWQINKGNRPIPYWHVKTGEGYGIDGAILQEQKNWQSIVNIIEVESVDIIIKKITELGGQVVMNKTAVPGAGYISYCRDTEGNLFGIMQNDPNAK